MFDSAALLHWYDHHKRTFPWRLTKHPYAVWICEVMSQQTTLGVVVPYYERFVQSLPTVVHLAAAEESLLRKLWAGLGYYSRVRNLAEGARFILANYGSNFPSSYEQWLSVPGCGPYTSAVLASICFNEAVPCIDGNVIRVASRLNLYGEEIHTAKFRKVLSDHLSKIIVTERPGDFNQALMELGATVCTPKNPDCVRCPLQISCQAFKKGLTRNYPPAKSRKTFKSLKLQVCVLQSNESGDILLGERSRGFLKGTSGFPLFVEDDDGARLQKEKSTLQSLEDLGLGICVSSRTFKHTITNHKILVQVVEMFFSTSLHLSRIESILKDAGLAQLRCSPVSGLPASLSTSLDLKSWNALLRSQNVL